MPRLSDIVSGWQNAGEIVPEDGSGEDSIAPHRRKVVRTRAAAAGPHPYLDRFASGMHRPLEGDDSSWRMASIQPVPIPDLSHTGIRTKFSPGAGNGFTPNGHMTSTFRTSIHETMRGLPGGSLGHSRDIKARDYARAIRNHKIDPRGGPLLHAHMSSLELGLAPGAGAAGEAGSAVASMMSHEGASVRRSASLGGLRGRLSPPSSPPSNRRALADYGGGDGGGGVGVDVGGIGGGDGVGVGGGGGGCAPADNRHALLQRELRSVRLASAAVASVGSGYDSGDFRLGATKSGTMPPRVVKTPAAGALVASGGDGGRGESQARYEGRANQELDASRRRGRVADDRCGTPLNPEQQRARGRVDVDRWEAVDCPRENEEPENEAGADTGRGSGEGGAPFDSDQGWQQERARGRRRSGRRRRIVPPATDGFQEWRGRTPSGGRALQASASSPSLPLRGTLASEKSARRKSTGKRSARSTRLKKPFSSDSLFACLLDVHYGNTRDLSPDKTSGRKWDLQGLPPRVTTTVAAPKAWDGFASED
ncbi:unnamed protein product, partial [Laminaria digitata]